MGWFAMSVPLATLWPPCGVQRPAVVARVGWDKEVEAQMSHVKTPRRGAILFLPGVLLVLSSCSGTEDGGSGTAAPSTGPTITATTQPERATFTRRDVPANGVARQVAFFIGAGDTNPECTFPRPLPGGGTPYIAMPGTSGTLVDPVERDATLEVFQAREVCLVGFIPNERVTITATAPNGEVERKSVIDKESTVSGISYNYTSEYYFSPRPGDPVGRYRIVAAQGARTAAMTVTVVPARKPALFTIPGGELELSGFRSGRRLAVNFYGGSSTDLSSYPTDPTAEYARRLLPYLGTMEVRLDGNGQGVYPWPEELDKGCFGVDAAGLPKYGQRVLCTTP